MKNDSSSKFAALHDAVCIFLIGSLLLALLQLQHFKIYTKLLFFPFATNSIYTNGRVDKRSKQIPFYAVLGFQNHPSSCYTDVKWIQGFGSKVGYFN